MRFYVIYLMNMKSKILILEDESDINDLIAYHLKKKGYDVAQAFTVNEAHEKILRQKPALLVLDLMLSDMSGVKYCEQLKADKSTQDIAILMLTAKSEHEDILKGFEAGADDYVTKPFQVQEVIARIDAILRRVQSDFKKEAVFHYRDLEIHWERHKVYAKKKEVKLTLTEFNILKTLAQNQGCVLTRDRLLDAVSGDANVIDRTIDVHMQALRKKIGSAKNVVDQYIETIRGVGYRFRDE